MGSRWVQGEIFYLEPLQSYMWQEFADFGSSGSM
jgi:hypothetical protein